jgi:hypothetical protein
LICAVLLLAAFVGCASDRQQLEEERSDLEQRREAIREQLDRNAPVGSRWSSHRDTGRLLGEMNGHDARIREIDNQLWNR